jgi:preprotein translocase subunit SecD
MKTRNSLLICTVLVLALTGMAASADQVYRWVDKDGHVHYSQTPPASTSVKAQTVNITPPAPDPVTLQNEQKLAQQIQDQNKQNQDSQKKAQQDAQQKAQQQQQCDALRQRLQVLQQSGRVATVDAQGNKTYIPDDTRAKQEQDLQDTIAKQCGGGDK